MTPLAEILAEHLEVSDHQLSWLLLSLAGAITLALMLRSVRALRGTTLRGPALWAVAAGLLLTANAYFESRGNRLGDAASAVRYLAAAVTLAPAMAVFGAKRPQDRAWFFIVFSLLIVLSIPAAEAWILRHGGQMELHGFRSAFLLILLFAGLGNYFPTRYAPAAVALATGQWMLLDEFLAWKVFSFADEFRRSLGTGCVFAAPWLVLICERLTRRRETWQDCWLRFRDAYGVIWGVRVAERFNQAMRQRGLQVHLGWRGFSSDAIGSGSPSPQTIESFDHTATRSLRALLTRFVSPESLPPAKSALK